MSYTAIQNNPIIVDLLAQAKTTGWSVDGVIATHDSCNAGSIILTSYPVTKGITYKVSYVILSISGGYCQVQSPGSNGVAQTAANLYVETITPTANGFVSFYSNANCQVVSFNIQQSIQNISNYQKNTLVFSTDARKWLFITIAPDFGFSLSDSMLTLYQGNLYLHKNGSNDRNVFYGVPYQTIIQYVDNAQTEISRTYMSMSIMSNQLMVTTPNGISTSLGHVSSLSEIDFIKDFLTDGTSSVAVETKEGIFSAGFLRDINSGSIENGDSLKGNWLSIQLTSTSNTPLRLYSINIVSKYSPVGSR